MSDKPIPSNAIAVRSETTLPGDAVPLIGTKVQVPRRRADLLVRNRLVNFIHGHLDCKLIVISAPAGYGKTSLLTDFAQDTELPVCWYALGPFDRDLTVFIEYLISAIARQFPKFGQRSRDFLKEVTDPSGHLYPMVATLVQDIYDNIPEYFDKRRGAPDRKSTAMGTGQPMHSFRQSPGTEYQMSLQELSAVEDGSDSFESQSHGATPQHSPRTSLED